MKMDFQGPCIPASWCDCFRPAYDTSVRWRELSFHEGACDPGSDADRQLAALVMLTAERGLTSFSPRQELGRSLWSCITRLPPSIGLMDRCETMDLYGSHLTAIPREIMAMARLRSFDPYTSYRLHWFPYEIARCPALRQSRVSTRALYGNHKKRPPFPRLPDATVDQRFCSICDAPLADRRPIQRWISLRVATDVLPLLVNACSRACLDTLPEPARGSIERLHRGGLSSRPPA